MLRNKKGVLLTLSVFILLFTAGFFFFNYNGATQGTTSNAQLNQRVQNALAEVSLPTSNNASAINASSASLADFIAYRSNVTLSQANKDLLAGKEQLAWNQSKKITKGQLASILTEMASDKLRDLTDAQRDSAVESLRGFNHSTLPANIDRSTVTLRANGLGRMTPAELTTQLNAIRGSNADSKITQGLIELGISSEIDYYISLLSDADPNFFGGTKGDMTPMQAVLISYAVVTNDTLSDNQTELTTAMQIAENITAQASGGYYPSHIGEKAYGLNGYFYSAPTDLLMTNDSIDKLITEIAIRSNL